MRHYDRDIQSMSDYERRKLETLEREQITHVSLKDYQPGAAHYERLMAQVEENRQHQWPSSLVFNV